MALTGSTRWTPSARSARRLALTLAGVALVASACSSSTTGSRTQSSTPAPAGTTSGSGTSGSGSLADLLPADIRSSGTMVMATDASYPPCEYIPSPGQPMVGFEPDLWNAMAAKLGIKINPVNTNFDGLIPGVQSGRYPATMECISDSVDREKQVSFVDMFYDTISVYTTKANSSTITSEPLTLCGRTAGVQSGTDFAGMLNTLSTHCTKNGKASIKINQYPAQSQSLLALYSGRADFILSDTAAAAYLASNSKQPVAVVSNALLPKLYLAVVINKSNTQLQNAFLAAAKAIIADGTYHKIMSKWGVSALEMQTPGINLASSNPLPTPTP